MVSGTRPCISPETAIRIGMKRFFPWYQFFGPLWFVGRYFHYNSSTWLQVLLWRLQVLSALFHQPWLLSLLLRSIWKSEEEVCQWKSISSTDFICGLQVPPISQPHCQTSCFFRRSGLAISKILRSGILDVLIAHPIHFLLVESSWDLLRRFSSKV